MICSLGSTWQGTALEVSDIQGSARVLSQVLEVVDLGRRNSQRDGTLKPLAGEVWVLGSQECRFP